VHYTLGVLTALIVLVVLSAAGYGAFRVFHRKGRPLGAAAMNGARAAAVLFLLSVAVYKKPQSFYVNFVIFPSLFSYLGGLLCVLVTIVIGVLAVVQQDDGRKGVIASVAAIVSAAAAMGIIIWRAS
jgi:hypothetical protein